MLMVMLRLITVISLIDNHNCGTLCLVVKTALPILFVAALAVPEISEAVEDEQVLSTSF